MSWVKLSAVLAGLSGVLTLRISLDDAAEGQSLRARTSRSNRLVLVEPSTRQPTTTRRARRRVRRRRKASPSEFAGTEQVLFVNKMPTPASQLGHSATSLFAQSTDQPTSILSQAPTGILDTAQGSLAAGCVYFVIALLSLCIGTIDYLQRERAIEQIDAHAQAEKEAIKRRKQTPHAANAAPDLGHATGTEAEDQQQEMARRHEMERSEVGVAKKIRRRRELYLADEDFEQARSGKIVTIMTAIVALVIAASAVLLLVDERRKRPTEA